MTDITRADTLATADAHGGVLVGDPVDEILDPTKRKAIIGRSPGQLAWMRLRRDRVGMSSAYTLVVFVAIGLLAPVIEKLYGVSPDTTHPQKLNSLAMPLGYLGGVSSEHWFGLEPKLGRDIFIHLVYGIRTSLFIAFAAASIAVAIGIVVGVAAGYLGGWLDNAIGSVVDFVLALPTLVFALAAVPVAGAAFYRGGADQPTPTFRAVLLIVIFAAFGWTTTARLVRGQVLSLREREYIEAARAAGAGTMHILFRQLLPNIWAPILITYSLLVPAFITAEGAYSFLGIGIPEPQPDLGRMIFSSTNYIETDPPYMLLPVITLFLIVLTFNLFGDSVRDALDPKSTR
jgi:peptide/nickel transport system permease protein